MNYVVVISTDKLFIQEHVRLGFWGWIRQINRCSSMHAALQSWQTSVQYFLLPEKWKPFALTDLQSQLCLFFTISLTCDVTCLHIYVFVSSLLYVYVSSTCRSLVTMCLRVIHMCITDTFLTACSTCECHMTPNLTCCSTWWPRSGSWICPSCLSQSTGACRTLNYSLNSSRSLAKGSSRLPWQQEPGYSPEGLTQVRYPTSLFWKWT